MYVLKADWYRGFESLPLRHPSLCACRLELRPALRSFSEAGMVSDQENEYGVALDIVEAKARTYELNLAMVPKRLEGFPGAVELVWKCQAAGMACAVASSADRIKIVANLNKIGLPPATWQAIVTAEDVEHRKPDPAIFLMAAQRLGVQPSQCTVVEDAVNGIAAAKAAWMRCVAVASTFPASHLVQADLIRPSISAVTLEDLR